MHEVLVNRLGGLSLPKKSVVSLTDLPDMNLDVSRGRKTTIQQQQNNKSVEVGVGVIVLCVHNVLYRCMDFFLNLQRYVIATIFRADTILMTLTLFSRSPWN